MNEINSVNMILSNKILSLKTLTGIKCIYLRVPIFGVFIIVENTKMNADAVTVMVLAGLQMVVNAIVVERSKSRWPNKLV